MLRIYGFLFFCMMLCVGCQWKLKLNMNDGNTVAVIERYDRIETLYLTTGDFSALQKMNTSYPVETRTLIEDVLKIGKVNDQEINTRFLRFYQDSVLQAIISEVGQQYADMEDVSTEMQTAFERLIDVLPSTEIPRIYTQIGSLDQSIIITNKSLGICLDKYLGADYPVYERYYTEGQRQQMVRSMIVPDCLQFYILSMFPLSPSRHGDEQHEFDMHIAKIQWTVNSLLKRKAYSGGQVDVVDRYMKKHKDCSILQLLSDEVVL